MLNIGNFRNGIARNFMQCTRYLYCTPGPVRFEQKSDRALMKWLWFLSGLSEGVLFTRKGIQRIFSPKFRPKLFITDVLSFGPCIGLNGWWTHLHQNFIFHYKIILVRILITGWIASRVNTPWTASSTTHSLGFIKSNRFVDFNKSPQ